MTARPTKDGVDAACGGRPRYRLLTEARRAAFRGVPRGRNGDVGERATRAMWRLRRYAFIEDGAPDLTHEELWEGLLALREAVEGCIEDGLPADPEFSRGIPEEWLLAAEVTLT